MILYHNTDFDTANAILRDGFQDGIGNYLTKNTYKGVWLADNKRAIGPFGDTMLEVIINLDPSKLKDYEWEEESKGFREYLIPAAVVNANSTVKIIDE
jgi:hypothetical protein